MWLHRYLIDNGVGNVVVDAGSLEARKKRRRVKTDRVDLEKLLRMLIRYHAGDQDVWSVVRVPGPGVEDRVNFQRVYDVKERVLPEWVDTTPLPAEEARRIFMELSLLFRKVSL